jgi:hypothetical protein
MGKDVYSTIMTKVALVPGAASGIVEVTPRTAARGSGSPPLRCSINSQS